MASAADSGSSSPGTREATAKARRRVGGGLPATAAVDGEQELRKLKSDLARLQRDNEALRQQLRPAQGSPFGLARSQSGLSLPPTGSAGTRIQRVKEMEALKDQAAALAKRIETAERKQEALSRQTDIVRAQLDQARQARGGVNVTRDNHEMIDKQVTVLEGRLEKAMVQFNEALHANRSLRQEIDALRREREVFDGIYKKLERELQQKKREMAFIIEVSNIAYEERDHAQGELAQLKVHAAKEMQSFEETFRELDELLEEDRKMKEAIKARMADRKERTTAAATVPAQPASKEDLRPTASPKSIHLPPLRTLPTVGQGGGQASAAAPEGLTAPQYEAAFRRLQAATNLADVNLLVQRFLRSEDDNFSLFTYLNELRQEIEELEASCAAAREELERMQEGPPGSPDAQRRQALQSLEERLQAEEAASRRYAALASGARATLEDIMAATARTFAALDGDEQAIAAVHGVAGITETTLPLYLGALEAKADGALVQWRRGHSLGSSHLKPRSSARLSAPQIEVPTSGDDYGDGASEDDDRVLSREELVARAAQKLAAQQQLTADGRKSVRRGARKR